MDTGFTDDGAIVEDTYVVESADCPLQATPATISFSDAPAMSVPQSMTITPQDCADPHVLLSAPQDWTNDSHFSITLPSSTRVQDQSTLEVVFTPSWNQEHSSEPIFPIYTFNPPSVSS